MAANRDYHAEYERRKARAAERGFPSFYAQRQAGPGAARWAELIEAGLVGGDTAADFIAAGVTDPASAASLEFQIDPDGNVTIIVIDPDGNPIYVPVPADVAWNEIWAWAEENDIDTEVQYEA